VALPSENLAIMYPAYALRGLGYPLFAYSFLVWISYRSEQRTLGAAVGWFWLVFTIAKFSEGSATPTKNIVPIMYNTKPINIVRLPPNASARVTLGY
jgi:hypothetical protein